MDDFDTDKFVGLAKKADASDAKIEYHPSIRALVKILARKAAEEQYDELLRALKNSEDEESE